MIAGLEHLAEWTFWVLVTAFCLIGFWSVCNAAIGWSSARVVYRPRNVVDFEKRRRLQLEATMRDERPIADEARTACRDAALTTIMRANRSVGGRS